MSPYWISAAVVVAGLALLVLVLMRAYRAFRTLVTVRGAVQGVISNEIGLLRARKAALGVAGRDRLRWRGDAAPSALRARRRVRQDIESRRLVQDDEGRP